MFSKERNGVEHKKPIEMEPLKQQQGNQPEPKSDVVIGRFRKISSAKSMANTNGSLRLSEFPATDNEDPESGLVFAVSETDGGQADSDKFVDVVDEKPKPKITPASGRGVITKSSFRNTDKPSRFKNNPSTRFQVFTLICN